MVYAISSSAFRDEEDLLAMMTYDQTLSEGGGTWLSPRRRALLEVGFLVVLTAASFMVRVWGMSRVHFWDEAVYLQNAEVICCGKANYSELDSRPPLLSLIIAAVFRLWHSVYAADVVAALLNAAGPALLYICGRRIVGKAGAAIAALLMAFTPFFVGVFPVGFDSDNTGNSLLTDAPALTMILLAFWALLRALEREIAFRFACAGFLLGLTVLMRFASLSTAGVLALLVFAGTRRWRAAIATALGFLFSIVPYLCWSRVHYDGFLETFRRGWMYYQGARESPLFLFRNFGIIFSWITLAGLVLWVYGWVREWRTPDQQNGSAIAGLPQRRLVPFLWVWTFALLALFTLMPHQEPRYAMPLSIPLFLLAGSGLSTLLDFRTPVAKFVGVTFLLVALAYSFYPVLQVFQQPFISRDASEEMEVAEYLDRNLPQGTLLYSNFNYPLFGYYSNLPLRELPESGAPLYSALEHLPQDGVLIAYSKPEIHPYPSREWLAAHPEFQLWHEFPSIALYRYHKTQEVEGSSRP